MAEILRWLVDHFRREGHVIRQAPVAFLAGLMILGAIIVAIVDWHYVGTDSAQRATIGMLQEELKGASPQMAALQSRRAAKREELLALYMGGAELEKRHAPLNASGDYTPGSDEWKAIFIADAAAWENKTTKWLTSNLGEAAKDKFLDVNIMVGSGSYLNSSDPKVFSVYTRVVLLERNLSAIIESSAFDK